MHSPPRHIRLHHLHHGDGGLVNFDKGPTEDLPQPHHLDHFHHFRADTFSPNRREPVGLNKLSAGSGSLCLFSSTYCLMRTAKASLFLAGGSGSAGLCLTLWMRVSSRCCVWLSFKKSSKRLNLIFPLVTYSITEMYT